MKDSIPIDLEALIEIEISKGLYGHNTEVSLLFEPPLQEKQNTHQLIGQSRKDKSTLRIPFYTEIYHPNSDHPENYYFYLSYNGKTNTYTIYDDHLMQSDHEYTKTQLSVLESTKQYIEQVREAGSEIDTSYQHYAELDRIKVVNPSESKDSFDANFKDLKLEQEVLNVPAKPILNEDENLEDNNTHQMSLKETETIPDAQEDDLSDNFDEETTEMETVQAEEVLSQWKSVKKDKEKKCMEYVQKTLAEDSHYCPTLFSKEKPYNDYNKAIKKAKSSKEKEKIYQKYKDQINEADSDFAKELQHQEIENFIKSSRH